MTAGEQARPPASAAVVVVPWTRNERAATAGLKTTSYADNVVALAYAKERGAVEAIFANTRGELCEGTGSNIFVVVDGVLVTPPSTPAPGRHHPRADPRVVPRGRPRSARRPSARRAADRRGGVHHQQRPATCWRCTRSTTARLEPGPVTARAAKVFARAAANGGPVSEPRQYPKGEAPEDLDDNITLDAADDRWEWRRQIRANPASHRAYRTVVAVLGLVVVVIGLIAVPAPGPRVADRLRRRLDLGVGVRVGAAPALLGQGAARDWEPGCGPTVVGQARWSASARGARGRRVLGVLRCPGSPSWLPDLVETGWTSCPAF